MASSSSVVPIEQKEGDYPNAGPTLQELTARAPEIGFKTKIPVDGKQSPIQKVCRFIQGNYSRKLLAVKCTIPI